MSLLLVKKQAKVDGFVVFAVFISLLTNLCLLIFAQVMVLIEQ